MGTGGLKNWGFFSLPLVVQISLREMRDCAKENKSTLDIERPRRLVRVIYNQEELSDGVVP